LLVGVLEVNSGRTTVGSVIAAMIVARYLITPVRILALAFDYYQSAKVSREKILGFLHRPSRGPVAEFGQKLRVRRGHIEFRDVSLDGSISNVSAEVQPGQVIALMGPNGSGKSSMLSLVARLADPDSGQILVDGQPLSECSLRSTAKHISLVSPDLPLLRGSLERALRYRWRDAQEEEITRVIELCDLEPVIAGIKGGLAGAIKEGGSNLSAGQAARLIMARGLVGNPPILLVDDPGSRVDVETKDVLRRALLRYGGTVLLATHDPREAAIADAVWKMQDGRIIEVISGKDFREAVEQPVLVPDWALVGGR
jgi:ATP-binding cassette, subfamily B, bacterial